MWDPVKYLHMKIADLYPTPNELDEGWRNWAAAGLVGAGLAAASAPAQSSPPAIQQLVALSPHHAPQATQMRVRPVTNHPHELVLLNAARAQRMPEMEIAQFMAQARHETENFTRLTERGSLRDFQKYDPKHNPAKARILGNRAEGDGARYRGRGYLHITGRYWYTLIGQAIGVDLERNPQLMANPDIAARASLWYWNNRVRPRVADATNTRQVTRRIHPGFRALPERQRYFDEYRASMRAGR